MSIVSCSDVCIGLSLSWEHCRLSAYQESVEINEQVSRRNSLNAICYRSRTVWTAVFPESRYVYQRSVEINEQLSRRNSLKALCYRSNCVNSVVFQNRLLCVWEVDIEWIKIDVVYFFLSLTICLSPMSVCDITGRVPWKHLILAMFVNSSHRYHCRNLVWGACCQRRSMSVLTL